MPATAARETSRTTDLRMTLPSWELTAIRLYPFWVTIQEILDPTLSSFPAHRAFVTKLNDARMSVYAGTLGIAAAGVFLALVLGGITDMGDPIVVAALAAVAAIAERSTVRLSHSVEVSVALLPVLFAAVVFGPLASMVVCAASMLADLLPKPGTPSPYLKWGIYTLSRSITGAVAGSVALLSAQLATSPVSQTILATAAAAIAAASLDVLFVSITVKLRGTGKLRDVTDVLGPVVLSAVPLYAPVVAVLAFAYVEISAWTLPLFFAPTLAAQKLFVLYQDQRRLTGDLVAVNDRLERANLSFAAALVATLDARDRYTAGHSAAVAIYSRDIAARMGLSDEQQWLAHLAGLVHDIGKVGLAPGLLEKSGPLTLDERRQMEHHAAIGERILSNVDDYSEIAEVVRHHHERVDGQGYPDRLVGEAIPLLARIIAVADAYNAMTSDRPYRDAMPSRVARLRLAQAVETQFDTSVVAAFEAILAGANETYRSGVRSDFRLEFQEQAATDALSQAV
jgi:HD-GYP domain-containing protein (c-di-GMP phosphodiesterase class II)